MGDQVGGSPEPDWAVLYSRHRDAMYRAAARVLRGSDRIEDAGDAVSAAFESLMKSPPEIVENWEALLVHAAKMRALDILGSAQARRESPSSLEAYDVPALDSVEDDVIDKVDGQRAGAELWDSLAVLGSRTRTVAWEYLAKGRPRSEVADELGVTPARISQIAKDATHVLRGILQKGDEP